MSRKDERQTPKCACSFCKKIGHTRRNCPDRAMELGPGSDECSECADLPWRRDVPFCPKCKGYYAPERKITLEEIMNRPADDRRTQP